MQVVCITKLTREQVIFLLKPLLILLIKLVQKYKKIGDKVAGVGQQAGNFLEKNSAILGDVAGSAAMATGFGAPIGASLISAGNIGQQMGQRLKQGSQEIRDASNRVGNLVQSQLNNASNQAFMAKNNISNQIKNNVGALNSQVGMSKQQMQQAIGKVNNDLLEFPAGFH